MLAENVRLKENGYDCFQSSVLDSQDFIVPVDIVPTCWNRMGPKADLKIRIKLQK